jgi:hypothetical protein
MRFEIQATERALLHLLESVKKHLEFLDSMDNCFSCTVLLVVSLAACAQPANVNREAAASNTEIANSSTESTGAAKSATDAARAKAMSAGVEFHCPGPGTLIRTSTHSEFKFTAENGMRCSYVDEGGTARERYALFADGFSSLARKEIETLWPLKVGNVIDFNIIDTTPRQPTDKFAQHHYHEALRVTGEQRVRVPAGSFDTFVIEWTETQIGIHQDRTEAVVTEWYEPRIGYFVKSSVNLVNAAASDPYASTPYASLTYEATEIAMPPGVPLPLAAEPAPAPAPAKAPAAKPAQGIAPPSVADRLAELKRLFDQKLISPEEYESHRKAILDAL